MKNLHASMFHDPAKWPSCPLCKKKASTQDMNNFNVFGCTNCDIDFVVGPGALPYGSKLVKDKKKKA